MGSEQHFASISYEEAMRRARDIVPTLRERAQKCEDARVLLPENEKLLHDTGATPVGLAGDGWDEGILDLREPADFCDDMGVVLVFGGDGTFLRAAYLTRDAGVPLLGVNLGRLGFLSEVEAADVPRAIERVVQGDFDVEERMTLAVQVRDPDGSLAGSSWALNEASVERTVPQRLIVLEVRVSETVFANVPADAIICATPTGSTAYAFSARGPILSPLVDAILLVPVAPHSLFDRTLVIDPAESLVLQPVGGDGCVVSLDGRETLPVPAGGSVTVSRGERPVRLARLGPFDFYQRVREKFGLQ
jgi:NAD+ kinase